MLFQEAKLPTNIQLNALIACYCVDSAQLVHLNGSEPRTDILSELWPVGSSDCFVRLIIDKSSTRHSR